MFAKLAKFKAVQFRHGAWFRHDAWFRHGAWSRHGTWPDGRLHAGGNRAGCRLAPASPAAVRPVLVCHWQPASGGGRGGGLECRWTIETVGETADGEPAGSWAVRQICRLTSIALPGTLAWRPGAGGPGGRRPDEMEN
jgi:hypothetical protein